MAKIIGNTAKVEFEDGSGYTEIPNVYSVKAPNPEHTEIDTTSLGSPDNHMESEPGMVDPGTVEITWQYDAEVYGDLFEKKTAGEKFGWKVTAPDGHDADFEFTAWIKTMDVDFTPNERNECTITLRVSGKVDYNEGA